MSTPRSNTVRVPGSQRSSAAAWALGLVAVAGFLAACGSNPASVATATTVAPEPPSSVAAPPAMESERRLPAGDATGLAGKTRELPSALGLPDDAISTTLPVAISFPAIGVDTGTAIDSVGIEPNGEMEIPSAERVGWYEYGSSPGRPGTTVLAGHIASGGVDGAFRDLAEAVVGDRFEVRLDDGSSVTYEVVEVAQYDKDDLPFDRVFARDGAEMVALVTCGGTFQPTLRSYEDNVVAYAVPIDG